MRIKALSNKNTLSSFENKFSQISIQYPQMDISERAIPTEGNAVLYAFRDCLCGASTGDHPSYNRYSDPGGIWKARLGVV